MERGESWRHTAVGKNQKPPGGTPMATQALGVLGSHTSQWDFSKKPRVRAGRDESDYYLFQAYHFTDEISLLIPISHMALRLVSLRLNHKDWLVCVCVCFSLEIFTKLTVSVATTNNLLLSLRL